MNLLSVDYDYFFPNAGDYDWGHSEMYSLNLVNFLWQIRELNCKIFDSENNRSIACIDYIADVKLIDSFWNNFTFHSKTTVSICLSHAEIMHYMKKNPIVYNFDAHHDYYNEKMPLHCGNWVAYAIEKFELKINNYHIIYPEWRKQRCDSLLLRLNANNIYYTIPENMPVFDHIFICKSPTFCPPWSDNAWNLLLNKLHHQRSVYHVI